MHPLMKSLPCPGWEISKLLSFLLFFSCWLHHAWLGGDAHGWHRHLVHTVCYSWWQWQRLLSQSRPQIEASALQWKGDKAVHRAGTGTGVCSTSGEVKSSSSKSSGWGEPGAMADQPEEWALVLQQG